MAEPRRPVPRYLHVLALIAFGFAVGRFTAPAPPPLIPGDHLVDGGPPLTETDGTPSAGLPVDKAELEGDALLTHQLLGAWVAQSHGTQVCLLKPDGTGRVNATLDFMASLLYGSQLSMLIEWEVRDGHLIQTLLGGEPEDKVAKLTKDFGSVRTYRIETLEEDHAILVDTSDGEKTRWTRTAD